MSDEFDLVTRGKVAAVISSTELALNRGASSGVALDDVVELIEPVEIRDPDSGENLGTVRVTRLNLEVTTVEEKFCRATVTDRGSSDGKLTIWNAAQVRPVKQIRQRELGDPMVRSGDVYVRKGDHVTISRPQD